MGIVLNPPPAPAPIIVTLDTGGYVDAYFAMAARYAREGRRIEIRGECRSACTVLLEVPTLCVRPGAVFRWHHAYVKDTGAVREDITEQMLARLPYRISTRLRGKIQPKYTPQASLGYTELVALGVPSCDTRPAVAADVKPVAPSLLKRLFGLWP